MPPRHPISVFDGHEVANQPPALSDYNLFDSDPILGAAMVREGAGWAAQRLHDFGAVMGSEHVAELAEQANRHVPELRAFDRSGRRIDEVSYHPAYHELMRLAKAHEVHSIAWTAAEPGGHAAHMGWNICCPGGSRCCPLP
jgi:putative acyl-CoA dehydrogenase